MSSSVGSLSVSSTRNYLTETENLASPRIIESKQFASVFFMIFAGGGRYEVFFPDYSLHCMIIFKVIVFRIFLCFVVHYRTYF